MALEPKDWLAVEQQMEEENHVLLQTELVEQRQEQPPQLLMISTHAVNGTISAATFSLLITIVGKQGVALVDSGNTDSFMDSSFASKTSCSLMATNSHKVKVAGGGHLDICAITTPTSYLIQQHSSQGQFKLLQLKGHDVIISCDWIRTHNPICLDLRDDSRQLSMKKEGH
jgi:hypothetical protein